MVNQPIQDVERRLRQLVSAIYHQPELPRELTQELVQACLALSGYIGQLRHEKRKLEQAWTELELQ